MGRWPWITGVVVVLCVAASGCGGGGRPTTAREFAHELADASNAVSVAVALAQACEDTACLRRQAAAAQRVVEAQVARIERDVAGADDGCFKRAGRASIVALRAYGSAAELAGRGREESSMAAVSRADTLKSQALRRLGSCTETP